MRTSRRKVANRQVHSFVHENGKHTDCEIKDPASLQALFPRVFTINAEIGLPESVPISFLADSNAQPSDFEKLGRQGRVELSESLTKFSANFGTEEEAKKAAKSISDTVQGSVARDDGALHPNRADEMQLARTLLCEIANIDPAAFSELHEALKKGKDAFVNGMIQQMNKALERRLNFPRYWAQDKDFQLLVSPREFDLVFTIKDRTGSEYAFNERSSGLKYFLSYYIQYLAYQPEEDRSRPEILLMDEPDAFLSGQGQQDLMKLFDAYADPEVKGRPPVQVVYVTHSPFLIDKNHAERIRVVEKGVDDEGTRVVRDVSKNHYEPLRSSFGAFVGETTFIGNCNLVVEGPADQILIAGMSTFLRQNGARKGTLDLNNITIVPAGSASHVPYIVYLARGRDVIKPAVIVLLDSDKAGKQALKSLKKGGANGKQVIPLELVLSVGSLKDKVKIENGQILEEIEDLIPLEIAAAAGRDYFSSVFGVESEKTLNLQPSLVGDQLDGETSLFDAIQQALVAIDPELHIEKMGFARSVLKVIRQPSVGNNEEVSPEAIKVLHRNMEILMEELTKKQRIAEREQKKDTVSAKLLRLRDSFLRDNPESAVREDVGILIEDIEATLDGTPESDAIRAIMGQLRREFNIEHNITQVVDNYEKLKSRLQGLRYVGTLSVQEDDKLFLDVREKPVEENKADIARGTPEAINAADEET